MKRILLLGYIALMAILVLVVQSFLGWEHASGLLLANTFATPDWVMRKVARRLVNNAVFANTVNRGYDDEYRQKGVKMGDTVKARLPQRYEVTIGAVMNPTPLTDTTVDVTITDQSNIGFEYDSWSATLEVDDYMERYGNPAVDALVNNIDYTGLARCYKEVAQTVGTPGVVPGSTGTLLSHDSTGRLKDFVVTANQSPGAGATIALPISPSLIIAGPYATASAAPANNAPVTTFGHASSYAGVETPQGLVYARDAFALVMADLILPRGLWVSERGKRRARHAPTLLMGAS